MNDALIGFIFGAMSSGFVVVVLVFAFREPATEPRSGIITRPTPPEWDQRLKALVGDAILYVRSGYYIEAAEAWHDIEKHWEKMENSDDGNSKAI